MLVLSRQRDETIVVEVPEGFVIPPGGIEIEFTVVDIRGDKVRLGITALREIIVHRKEVRDAIRREKEREAASLKDGTSSEAAA